MKLLFIFLGLSILVLMNITPIQGRTTKHNSITSRFHQTKSKRYQREVDERYRALRTIVRDSRYVTMTYQNKFDGFAGYAGANVQLISDGPRGNSTGVPYFYLAITDPTYYDLSKDTHLTIFLSQAFVDDSCYALPLGVKDDDCPIGGIAGEKVDVEKDSDEFKFALNALIEKYPAIKDLNPDKHFMARLDVKAVFIKQPDGTATPGNVEDYFKAKPALKLGK